ncbi:threonine-tRNA ligase [Schizosaccharomyces japonicus yFS275]|uniref:threonine--tRNA ligase n=1 Tax=Schizosaccharomyces japonicus (strain yFS275 / FY16936) TaxID=402676 RepID=B6K4M3_SCHJY|nr:threonine-tRNA ligase [Schizosaccharomyces japonicus yFS275]EEB08430.1 threonine-tRNA ligase [Schizosaccharomyces japonicus yFS275]
MLSACLLSPRNHLFIARFSSRIAAATKWTNSAEKIKFEDHRSIAARQKLFTINHLSPGSIYFLPHGTRIINSITNFLRTQYEVLGFKEVITPLIYKPELWKRSGHLSKYKENMFFVTSEHNSEDQKDSSSFGLKPMNCPAHCLLFAEEERSYKELPLRFADFSTLHRYEASGALSGLTRLRSFHQDDGHIFCRRDQVYAEIQKDLLFIKKFYALFHMNDLTFHLSTRPTDYIGEADQWDHAERILEKVLTESGMNWKRKVGDGAFYGPKIDVHVRDTYGRSQQTATIQLDFQLPKRFQLRFRTEHGDNRLLQQYECPVLIHRAVLGSLERFLGILIEHLNGKWPFWISPRHAIILTLNQNQDVMAYAKEVQKTLSLNNRSFQAGLLPLNTFVFHVDLDCNAAPLGRRLNEARKLDYNYEIVIGTKETENHTLAVSERGSNANRRMIMTPELLREMFENRMQSLS